MKLLVLLFIAGLLSSSEGIIYPSEGSLSVFSMYVDIIYNGHERVCGGVIIDDLTILTVASCVDRPFSKNQYSVRTIASNLKVTNIEIHEKYYRKSIRDGTYDIAKLTVNASMTGGGEKVVTLTTDTYEMYNNDNNCYIVSMGYKEPNEAAVGDVIQLFTPVFQEPGNCSKLYTYMFPNAKYPYDESLQVCSIDYTDRAPFQQATCADDNGAPLVCSTNGQDFYLQALVQTGFCKSVTPVFYTWTSNPIIYEWITGQDDNGAPLVCSTNGQDFYLQALVQTGFCKSVTPVFYTWTSNPIIYEWITGQVPM